MRSSGSFLPAPERLVGLAQVQRRIADFHDAHRDAIFELTELIAAVPQALAASDRADRQLAMLRIEEAIRLHAHAHLGELPKSLEAINEVPIPLDPLTGKAFLYRVEKGAAIVETPPDPPSVSENPVQRRRQERRYIIHLRK